MCNSKRIFVLVGSYYKDIFDICTIRNHSTINVFVKYGVAKTSARHIASLRCVGVPCFDILENQKTRQHQNQSLEFQDLVLLFSERDLSNIFLQRFILCALIMDLD